MLGFKKILLPIDLEQPDLEMVHQTSGLARHFKSEIVILHVIQPLSSLMGFSDTLHGNLLNESVQRAESQIDASVLREFDGLPVRRFVAKGNPAKEIVATARELNVDLIVMGTHGLGDVERVLIGSVTVKVLNHAECSVWAGSQLSAERQRNFSIKKILCAVEFSEHSRNTARAAAQIASEFGAHLTLAHVTPSAEIYGPGGQYVVPQFKTAVVGYATQEMEKLQNDIGVRGEVFIGSGDVGKTLGEAIRETHADLLMIGRGSTLSRLGNSGYAIIREAHIPVLSV